MASEFSKSTNRAPVDPMIRLSIALSFCRREWRLLSAIVVAAVISVIISISLKPSPSAFFDRNELRDLGGLPLHPAGDVR